MRLAAALLVLLVGYGVLVALLFRHEAAERESALLQGLSRDLAAHIVAHWPEVAPDTTGAPGDEARAALIRMLMTVNPGIQVYLLDDQGRVLDYLGEPGMVRMPQVALAPLRRFLEGAALPLRGGDPMGSGQDRLFSAAPLPAGGYLYVVLDGAPRQRAALAAGDGGVWRSTAAAAVAALVVVALLGVFTLRRLSRPLHRLAARMQAYAAGSAGDDAMPTTPPVDEVARIEQAFVQMTARIEQQAERERAQAAAHRDAIAGVAHDLRTPLTALHGQLEALVVQAGAAGGEQQGRPLQAALAQSERLRRLSQQLFELAALQSATEVAQRERFRIDELVADAVGKFGLMAPQPGVAEVRLGGDPPAPLEVEGDLQLVERALTNLIDNARRHGHGAGPVTVRMTASDEAVQVMVEDRGPGLPEDVQRRLAQGQAMHEPPLRRASGGIGGLGLAIAQRVAVLHGGSLRPLPGLGGGTRLCLVLPRAR
ncbi:MAG: HAMP domain-containing histidine kinase [Rubrivivax sp.]|nr:HAMP domain-containing histidine kinase [Rubrivivax sp.]